MLDKSKLVKKSTVKSTFDFEDFVTRLKTLGYVLIHSIVNHVHVDENHPTIKFKGKKMPDIGNNRGWQLLKIDIDTTDKPVEDDTRQKVTIGNNKYAQAVLQAQLESEIYFVTKDIEDEFSNHEDDTLDAIFKTEKKEYKKKLKTEKAKEKKLEASMYEKPEKSTEKAKTS